MSDSRMRLRIRLWVRFLRDLVFLGILHKINEYRRIRNEMKHTKYSQLRIWCVFNWEGIY